jgi:hypothetical protein
MAKKAILNRYALTETGKIIIDVSASRVQDLYNDFDKTAPYIKKDLEGELVEYLLGCAHEIGKKEFVICFNVDEPMDKESINRVKESVRTYFSYLKELGSREIRDMLRRSFFLLFFGLSLLMLSLWVNKITSSIENVFVQIIAPGLTVVAWVSLWEAIATFLIQWRTKRKEIKLFERLSGVDISF